jgi:hypothetical protein
MNAVSYAGSFAQQMSALQLDDSSVALLALLLGMIGGWQIPTWHAQLKAKRARVLAQRSQTVVRQRD